MDSQDDFYSTSDEDQDSFSAEDSAVQSYQSDSLEVSGDPAYRRMMKRTAKASEVEHLNEKNSELMDEIRGLEKQVEKLKAKCALLQKENDELRGQQGKVKAAPPKQQAK